MCDRCIDWDATWRGGTEWQKYPPGKASFTEPPRKRRQPYPSSVIVDIWDEDSRASVDPRVKRRRNKRRDPNPARDTVEEKGEEEDEPMAGEEESEARKRRQAGEVTSTSPPFYMPSINFVVPFASSGLILPPPPGAVFKSSNLRPRGVFPSSSSRVYVNVLCCAVPRLNTSSGRPKTRRYRQAFVAEVGRFQYRVVHR